MTLTTRMAILFLLMLCRIAAAQPPVGQPAPPNSSAPPLPAGSRIGADVLLRTETGELIPLRELLGGNAIEELLARSQEQRSIPRYTIAQLELTGTVERDVVTLNLELQIQVRPEMEWVTVPLSFGDVYVMKAEHSSDAVSGQAVLGSGEQNTRQWHLSGTGLHSVTMKLVGKTRTISPGVSQFSLNLPSATASHASLAFAAPVELQKLPTGSVDQATRDEQGVRSVEFWGLASAFSLTWSDVVPRVAQKPVIQVESRMKLDLTTIPVAFTGSQILQISGSAVSEVQVVFPDGFQLQEMDARNTSGVSVLNNFEVTPSTGPVTALVRLTTATEGSLTLSFDLELTNRTFPQDIRVALPSIQDANVQSGDLDILFPTGLLVQQTRVEGAQRKRVATETDLSVAATAFRMRSTDSIVELHVEETEAQFAVSPELTVTPEGRNVILTAQYPISVLQGSLLDLAIHWPGYSSGDWQILPGSSRLITDKAGKPLPLQQSDGEADVLHMTFLERQSGEFMIEFKAFAPLDQVRSGAVQLLCPELKSRRGQPFVLTTIESDEYSIRPISMGTGELLPIVPLPGAASATADSSGLKSEGWLQDDPSIPIRLELPEQAPSVRAQIVVGLAPHENGIEVQETIRFEIEHRDLASLSLRVPDGVEPSVRITGQTEPLRATIESATTSSFRLPEARRGSLSVDVTWLMSVARPTVQPTASTVHFVPVILPESAEVSSVVAGTAAVSGLSVGDDSVWQPVFSEQFDSAWLATGDVTSIPVKTQDRLAFAASASPDLILVRTQVIGSQAMTSTLAVYESLPDVIAVETPEAIDKISILLGGESLTSGDARSQRHVRPQTIADRRVIRWLISTKDLTMSNGPVALEFRIRERLSDQSALWMTSEFRRAAVIGESPSVPVIWYAGSQDEYQVAGASDAFGSLTQQGTSMLPWGESVRGLADRQLQAVLSPYPTELQDVVRQHVDEWMSLPGRQDMFFGSADSGLLRLHLLPKVSLLLVSAALCVLFFLVMTGLRQVTMTAPLLFVVCLTFVAWLIVPEWTLVLTPYVAMGTVFGMVSIMFQRLIPDRRIRFPRTPAVGDYPTVFGFSGLLTPSVVERRESKVTDEPQRSEISVGSVLR